MTMSGDGTLNIVTVNIVIVNIVIPAKAGIHGPRWD